MKVIPIEILIVEDREDDVIVLRRAFKDARICNPMHVFDTGEAALDYIREALEGKHPVPGLLLLDLGLPDMTGLELLQRVREEPRLEHLPVIVLTISDQDEDIIRSYDLGVQAFVQKPARLHNIQDFFLASPDYSFVVTCNDADEDPDTASDEES